VGGDPGSAESTGGNASSGGGETGGNTGGSATAGGGGVTGCAVDDGEEAPCTVKGPLIPRCVDESEPVVESPDLIDDFEDCNTCLLPGQGRRGLWSYLAGMDEWLVPYIGPVEGRASRALSFSGQRGEDNIYLELFLFLAGSTFCDENVFDASEYDGIAFSMRNFTRAPMKLYFVDGRVGSGVDAGRLDGLQAPLTHLEDFGSGWNEHRVYWDDTGRPSDDTAVDPTSLRLVTWASDHGAADYHSSKNSRVAAPAAHWPLPQPAEEPSRFDDLAPLAWRSTARSGETRPDCA
jgi:hypothetical protein